MPTSNIIKVSFSIYVRKVSLGCQSMCCRCRDRMVVGFSSTCAISAYHHQGRS